MSRGAAPIRVRDDDFSRFILRETDRTRWPAVAEAAAPDYP